MEPAHSSNRSESRGGAADIGEAGGQVKRAVALTCFLLGCGAIKDPSRDYIQLAVALGEHDPNSLDYYYGPPEWVAEVRAHTPKLAEIKQAALDLVVQVQPEARGHDYLIAQLRAITERVDLLQGVRPSFEEEASTLFGLQSLPAVKPEQMEAIRKEIGSLLPGKGTPAERYAAFDERFVIPDDKVAAVMQRALQGCRERSLKHLPLPAGEEVKVEYVSNRPWNAYSRYQGHFRSLIQVNADFALTVDRALQLACHEGYPGHHAYNSMQDAELVQRQGRLELMVQPTFSPQSLVSEALATYAVEMAFPPADRLEFERDVLFPIAEIDKKNAETYLRVSRLVDELEAEEPAIARDYLDGKLEWARAASALEDRALMAHTEATIKYLNEFRTYMLTYTVGKEMARSCVTRAAGDRWQVYEELITWQLRLRDCAK
jgi:hypothetical protein